MIKKNNMFTENAFVIVWNISFITVFSLITLKLAGIIAWSWLWIFAPIWIPVIFCAVCIIALFWILRGDDDEGDE